MITDNVHRFTAIDWLNIFTQESTMKRAKLSREAKCHDAEQSAVRHDDAKSRQSCVKSELTDELRMFPAEGSSFSRSSRRPLAAKPKTSCDEKVSRRDAADIVVRQLTPYYKSNRFGSKVCVHLIRYNFTICCIFIWVRFLTIILLLANYKQHYKATLLNISMTPFHDNDMSVTLVAVSFIGWL